MKILFSPSETKTMGGISQKIEPSSFIFPQLFEKRKEVLYLYQDFIQSASQEQLEKLFGTKKEAIITYYKQNLFEKEIEKVIKRYDGVAFDYLKYNTLPSKEQHYIDQNVIIFSNLFGPLLAGDMGLPDYKLKQGEKLGNFSLEDFYKEHFSNTLDDFLKDEEILDLRAGFYEKFYTIKKPYLSLKFIKDKKVVSHWAKAYRGTILRLLAKNQIESIEQFLAMEIEELSIVEIKEQKFKKEIVYEIR